MSGGRVGMEVWRRLEAVGSSGGGRRVLVEVRCSEAAGSVDTVAEVPILEVLEVLDGVCESLTES